MNIEIYSGIDFLLSFDEKQRETRQVEWDGRIVKPFQEVLNIIQMDFEKMGAVCPGDLEIKCKDTALKLQAARVDQRINKTLISAYQAFLNAGHVKFPETLKVGVFVSTGENPFHNDLNRGFSGFGGIPGFIILILSPTDFVLERIEPLVAHEFHHNLRYMIDPWPCDMNISVGKYLLDEGMAEMFAAELYGEEMIGHWSTGLSSEELARARQIIEPHIAEKGFKNAQAYLFGDPMADTSGYAKTGLPHAAGYAVGYQWVKEYLKKSRKTIFDVTKESTETIMETILKDEQ
ncbi:MAG: hypothetical protein H0U49_12150 [Parachlamydiaceae bacterium]|nr:hypothetical protein [Parachlamydiaceae bacterium]